MAGWTQKERRDNAVSIMKGNIDRHDLGSKLTPSARNAAAEFAADVWQGNMGNGEAAEIGIRHVTEAVIKQR